ncbi:MAG: PLDc N-terminal domain-containing protein [Acidimicrobiales bacterium]
MIRFAGGGLIAFALIVLWIYCIFDVISTEEVLIRSLPKMAWLFIVIILPDIGSLAWLALGRPAFAGWRPGDTGGRQTRRVVGPEDRDDFASSSGPPDKGQLEAWEADLLRREQELRKDKPEDPPSPPMTW